MKKGISIFIALVIFIFPTIIAYANTNESLNNPAMQTPSPTESFDYYCEINEFDNNHINDYIKLHPEQQDEIQKLVSEDKTICSMVNYEYYVSETYDKYGNIIDSHLMTDKEVNDYKQESLNSSIPFSISAIQLQSTGLVDSDFESKGNLSIGLVVYKNSDGSYTALGNAKWNTSSVLGGTNYPDAAGDDFFAITWGGNGELKCTSATASGSYQNGTTMQVSKSISDSYKGYCWQFLEKSSGVGSCMNSLSADVSIKKTYSTNKNTETNIMCTYIHTYSKVVGSISFNASVGNLAGGITLSSVDKQWQISCDVAGIKY